MKFLLYSQSGEGAQILKRIELEGNECALFVKDKVYKSVFDGLLEKTENPDSFIDEDTVIIFDMSGNGSIADSWRSSGHFVYGASEFSDKLEHDRKFGFETMKKAGIQIPDYKEFSSFEIGREYVRSANKRLVFKPSGSMPTKLTYCSKDAEELIAYMKFVEKQFGKNIDSFVLQDFIEGVVVSSEMFCQNGDLILPFNHTVEVKKSMNDDLGPSTGCSGNITWTCDENYIIQSGIAKMKDICKKEQFTGQIDLNAVVSDQGVFGLEYTPRFGYDATPTLLSLLEIDLGEFFSNIARGESSEISIQNKYAGGVRVTIPPYPVETEKDPEEFSPSTGIPILNYEEYEQELYFYEVALVDDQLCHSSGTGVIACAMGIGQDAAASLLRPYDILENLVIPDKQYRTDLEQVLPEMISNLEEIKEYA
jgi:phosphoribosylamine--glycine ligase